MRRIILFIFTYWASLAVQAQDLQQYISPEAVMVGVLNAQNCSTKIDREKLLQSQAFQQLDQNMRSQNPKDYELMSQIYRNPAEVGINLYPKSYLFVEPLDSMWVTGYLFALQDVAKFEKLVAAIGRSEGNQGRVNQKNNFQYLLQNDFVIAWSKNTGLLITIDGDESFINESIDYADTLAFEKSEEMKAEFKVLKINTLVNHIPNVLSPKTNAIASQANFKLFNTQVQVSDFGFWLNIGKMNDRILSKTPKPATPEGLPIDSFTKIFSNLYQDTYIHVFGLMNNGELKLQFQNHLNPKMANTMAGVYDKRPNPQLFNYLKANQLLGFVSFAIDIEKYARSVWVSYEQMLDNLPETGKKAKSIIELLDIVIDEKALYSLMRGDMLLAVTDLKEVETTYTSYEYDDNFNPVTVEKKKKEKLPIITLLATIGNQDNFKKIIKALQTLESVTVEKNYFKIKLDKIGIPIFIATQNDILICTNDADLVANLPQGVPAEAKISAEWQNLMNQHSLVYMMDFKHIIQAASTLNQSNSLDKKTLDNLKNTLNLLKITGVEQKGNVIHTEAVLKMNNASENVLHQLLGLLDKK